MKNNIAILIPYFGKWPEWIDLYFKSCSFNSTIDWFFFTDCEIPVNCSPNLYFYKMSFADYCKEVSEKLGIDFYPESPYKLCGLRPFYASLHKDLIKDYDFWGFGDVDVVWGDLKKFYTNELLQRYDVFSTHADRLSGHLTIIRNTNHYTNLCFKIKDWQQKLVSIDFISLDEQDFSWLIYPQARFISRFYGKVVRKLFNWRDAWVLYYSFIMPVYNWLMFTKTRKLYFKEQHTTPILGNDGLTFKHDTDKWYYRNGEIINSKTNQEYIYLHFMIYKKNGFRSDYFWKYKFYNIYNVNERVVIDKSGFYN